jgi:hypothetical protein
MNHVIEISEEERQMMLLAIAKLSIERPGWYWTLGQLAEKLGDRGRTEFEEFRTVA